MKSIYNGLKKIIFYAICYGLALNPTVVAANPWVNQIEESHFHQARLKVNGTETTDIFQCQEVKAKDGIFYLSLPSHFFGKDRSILLTENDKSIGNLTFKDKILAFSSADTYKFQLEDVDVADGNSIREFHVQSQGLFLLNTKRKFADSFFFKGKEFSHLGKSHFPVNFGVINSELSSLAGSLQTTLFQINSDKFKFKGAVECENAFLKIIDGSDTPESDLKSRQDIVVKGFKNYEHNGLFRAKRSLIWEGNVYKAKPNSHTFAGVYSSFSGEIYEDAGRTVAWQDHIQSHSIKLLKGCRSICHFFFGDTKFPQGDGDGRVLLESGSDISVAFAANIQAESVFDLMGSITINSDLVDLPEWEYEMGPKGVKPSASQIRTLETEIGNYRREVFRNGFQSFRGIFLAAKERFNHEPEGKIYSPWDSLEIIGDQVKLSGETSAAFIEGTQIGIKAIKAFVNGSLQAFQSLNFDIAGRLDLDSNISGTLVKVAAKTLDLGKSLKSDSLAIKGQQVEIAGNVKTAALRVDAESFSITPPGQLAVHVQSVISSASATIRNFISQNTALSMIQASLKEAVDTGSTSLSVERLDIIGDLKTTNMDFKGQHLEAHTGSKVSTSGDVHLYTITFKNQGQWKGDSDFHARVLGNYDFGDFSTSDWIYLFANHYDDPIGMMRGDDPSFNKCKGLLLEFSEDFELSENISVSVPRGMGIKAPSIMVSGDVKADALRLITSSIGGTSEGKIDPNSSTGKIIIKGKHDVGEFKALALGNLFVESQIKAQDVFLTSVLGNVVVESLKTRVKTKHGYSDSIPMRARIEAQQIIDISAGNNVHLKGVETSAALRTHIQALANIYDLPVSLLEENFRKSKHSKTITKNVTQISSDHTSGSFTAEAKGISVFQGAHITSEGGTHIKGDQGVALGASHDMESSQYKYKKKGFLTKKVEKGVDQSTTSHPVEIKSADKTIIETSHGNIDSEGSTLLGGKGVEYRVPEGKLKLEAVEDVEFHNKSSSKSGMVLDKLKSSGEHTKTVKPCFHDPGTGEVKIDADEVHVTQRVDQKNIEDVLTKALENVVSVTWSQIEDKHDSWNKSSKHINARFAAVVSIAVSLATAGYGAAFIGPLASAAGVGVTATEAALLSGFSAFIDAAVCVMSSRLAVNIIDAQGNVAKAWTESTKKNSIRSLLSNTLGCALTAGLIAGLNIEISAAQSIAEGFEESGIRILSATATRTLIEGESFEDALKGSILSISADVLGKHLSREIGNAHRAGELSDFSHLGAHAVLGASMAAAKGGDFLSGGFGAVVGEVIAQHYRNVVDLDSLPPGGSLWTTLVDRGVDLSKLSTSLIAFLAGLDPEISADAAANAAKNNALFVPVFYAAVGACTLYEGYEIYQTYKNEGPEAALEELALAGAVTIVTAGAGKIIYRVGKVAYPTAEAAFIACQAKSPTLTRVVESLSGTADKAKSLIDEIARMKNEGISKVGNLFGVKKSLDDIINKSTPLPRTGGGSQLYKNSGGFNQANKDFDSLRLEDVKSISLHGGGFGRVGLLPDGRKVVVRPMSSDKFKGHNSFPTLEIQNSRYEYTKIRY